VLSVFLVLLGTLSAAPDLWELMIELPPGYRVALWLPLLTLPVALLLPGQMIRGFVPHTRAPLARLHYLLLIVATATVLVGACFWNLVPWKG
jgi:hypothetical protein